MAENENQVWWILSILIDQTLGEIAAMAVIDEVKLVSQPQSDAGMTLAELLDELLGQGENLASIKKLLGMTKE